MKEKIRVLFIKPWDASFINTDAEILDANFDVKIVKYDGINPMKKPVKSMLNLIDLAKETLRADICFTWFAGFHALIMVLLAKIFKRKSIVVVGGYEVAKVPEINYGALLNQRVMRRIKWTLEHADKILAVSEFSRKEILDFVKIETTLIYNAVDTSRFTLGTGKEDLVITVGFINRETITRKGFETFVKAARYLPEVRFVLIGDCEDRSIDLLRAIAPKNVLFPGFLSKTELINYYQRAKVYCQLSRYESFGVSLAEAMSCGCVPVVTPNGALPEVVGKTGFYARYGDVRDTVEAIRKALNSDNGEMARKRVEEMFSLEKRKKELIRVVKELLWGESDESA